MSWFNIRFLSPLAIGTILILLSTVNVDDQAVNNLFRRSNSTRVGLNVVGKKNALQSDSTSYDDIIPQYLAFKDQRRAQVKAAKVKK